MIYYLICAPLAPTHMVGFAGHAPATEGIKILQLFLDDIVDLFLGDLAVKVNHPVSVTGHLCQLAVSKVRRDDLMFLKEPRYILIRGRSGAGDSRKDVRSYVHDCLKGPMEIIKSNAKMVRIGVEFFIGISTESLQAPARILNIRDSGLQNIFIDGNSSPWHILPLSPGQKNPSRV